MDRSVVTWLVEHTEDLALLFGALLLSVGCGLAFGFAYGLVAGGVLLVAYGVWMTPPKRAR